MLSCTILVLQMVHHGAVTVVKAVMAGNSNPVGAKICIINNVAASHLLIDHLLDLACPMNGDGLKALHQVLQSKVCIVPPAYPKNPYWQFITADFSQM